MNQWMGIQPDRFSRQAGQRASQLRVGGTCRHDIHTDRAIQVDWRAALSL